MSPEIFFWIDHCYTHGSCGIVMNCQKSNVYLRTFSRFLNLGWVEIPDVNVFSIVMHGLVMFQVRDLGSG